MRYKEFAIESYELDEEISLSKYDPEVKKVILTGMVKALNDVSSSC